MALNRSEQEKIELEHQAAKIFMRLYEAAKGVKIRHIWHNKPVKPDVSCRLKGVRLDLEVAHLYASEQEAMKILGRELGSKTREALKLLERQKNIEKRLVDALQRILLSKAEKKYRSDRVWLVIRNAHPEWTAELIARNIKSLHIPQEHPFDQIWLVTDFEGKSGIIELFPKVDFPQINNV
ncbi:hypothetical protein [Pleionea sediminis]|uniref:hypothetical protein n=1 Tax=Pleionea sediminis TaxID=2569479 RepID=UPI0011852D3C|nr:hypothetical protein [Pleionea sediminis]